MATITIRETDLTSNNLNNVTTNAAYVPGYAIMGPINTPTLCETLAEFKEIFGDKPYSFISSQPYPAFASYVGSVDVTPVGNMYEAGAYEKSYTYAADLLNQGLPVYFERVFDATSLASWKATLSITGLPVATSPATNPTVVVTSDTALTATVKALLFSQATNNTAGSYTFTYDSDSVAWTLGGTNISLDTYGITVSGATPNDGDTIAVTYTTETALTITAKDAYTGRIGQTIRIELETISGSTTYSDRYKLIAYRVDSVGNKITSSEESKQFVLTQTYDADKAFILYTDLYKYFTLIDITWSTTACVAIPAITATALTLNVSSTEDEFTVVDMYSILNAESVSDGTFTNPFERLQNIGDYNIKFITSGAYPLFEVTSYSNAVKKQALAAANRCDATAIIDYANKVTRNLAASNTTSVKYCFTSFVSSNNFGSNTLGEAVESYTTMFIPYGIYSSYTLASEITLPGSYGYLIALANSVQTNANWLAVAGVKRGAISNLISLSQNITNAIANSYQTQNEGDVAINPITRIGSYGYVIWGNRTSLQTAETDALKASAFLNVRQLVSDLKKVVFNAARKLTFEPNSDVVWINFKSEIEPTLTSMLTGQGITKYQLTKVATTKKATIVAKIRIWPIEAVEDWDITIELADGTTTVTE